VTNALAYYSREMFYKKRPLKAFNGIEKKPFPLHFGIPNQGTLTERED
jgi:hypothetical protein